MSDSSFAGNSATVFGVRIAATGTSSGTVTDCTFTSNSSPFAGAINAFLLSGSTGLVVSGLHIYLQRGDERAR